MIRSAAFRLTVAGLAFVIGFGLAYGLFEASQRSVNDLAFEDTPTIGGQSASAVALPDPLARRSRSTGSFLFIAFLMVVATGSLWLGRRRTVEPEEDSMPGPQGPHLIFERNSRGRKRSPDFYEDLRQRETTLESLEGEDPERRTQKVIELPVRDRRSVKSDRHPSH
jgi:hypothetical protein